MRQGDDRSLQTYAGSASLLSGVLPATPNQRCHCLINRISANLSRQPLPSLDAREVPAPKRSALISTIRQTKMRFGLKLLLTSLLMLALCHAETRQAFQNVSWSPTQIETGSPCLFKIEMDVPATSLHGAWQEHDIVFVQTGEHTWYGLAGVDVEAKPGDYKLNLTATLSSGKQISMDRTISVTQAPYKSE